MTLAASNDIRINRLQVHGRTDDIDTVQHQMALVNWPVNDKTWVFIRSLKVATALHSVSSSLTQASRKVVSQGDESNIKIFHSLSELLCELVTDIAQNLAHHKWYWDHWTQYLSLPTSAAITELLIDYKTETMSVLNRLNQTAKTLDVLASITEQDMAKLQYVHFPNKSQWLTKDVLASNAIPKSVTPASNHAVSAWTAVFRSTTLPKGHLRWLAANLAQHHFPIVWLKEPERLLNELIQLGSQSAKQANPNSSPLASSPDMENGLHIQRSFNIESKPIPSTKPLGKSASTTQSNADATKKNPPISSAPGLIEEFEKTNNPIETEHLSEPTPITTQTKDEETRTAPERPKKEEPNDSTAFITHDNTSQEATKIEQHHSDFFNHFEHAFTTHFGGTFYLLNILNRKEAQLIMGQHWQKASHGFLWLHQLATRLGLPEQDGIDRYIANELNMELMELTGIPELDGLADIIDLANQWYGKANLWKTDLLILPATIEANESHLDMTVSDTFIDIDVRKMGLDVNPGWLPWLGKVVKFHFVSGGQQ